MSLQMTAEKKLTLTAATTLLVTILFAYFTWSVNKWTSGIELMVGKTWDTVTAREPRIVKLEGQMFYVHEANSEVKKSIVKLETKIDRMLDMLIMEKKERASK